MNRKLIIPKLRLKWDMITGEALGKPRDCFFLRGSIIWIRHQKRATLKVCFIDHVKRVTFLRLQSYRLHGTCNFEFAMSLLSSLTISPRSHSPLDGKDRKTVGRRGTTWQMLCVSINEWQRCTPQTNPNHRRTNICSVCNIHKLTY